MSVAAIVLAAGGSSRMGRPKQLLPFRGVSLLRHAIEAAVGGGCEPVVVVLGAGAERFLPELAGTPAIAVENPEWAQGTGTSIRAGLAAVGDADAALFLTCDQPFVDAAHVRRLLDEYRASGQKAVASAYDGSVGVPALFDRSLFADLLALPPAEGAKRLLLRRPDRVAAVPFPAGAIDLDTPAEYDRWRPPDPGASDAAG